MTDTFAAITSSEILLTEPNFSDPKLALTSDKVPVRGASPQVSVFEQSGISAFEGEFEWISKNNKEELYGVFDFWRILRGRVRSFWMPTWVSDWIPAGGTGTNQGYLDVVSNSAQFLFSQFSDLSNPPYTRGSGLTTSWGVMFLLKNEDRHFRLINSYVNQGGGVHRIDFVNDGGQENLPNNLSPDDFALISMVHRVRSKSDEISIRFNTDETASLTMGVAAVYYES